MIESEPTGGFAAISSGVVSFLGAPHVPTAQLSGSGARAAFLGFPYEGGNAAIERPGSSNGPRALRIASSMCFPWSFEWDIDLFDAYTMVDSGDSPVAVGNLVRTHEMVQAEIGNVLSAGALPITIGGDHSLCIPGARALSDHLAPASAWDISRSTPTWMLARTSAASFKPTATG